MVQQLSTSFFSALGSFLGAPAGSPLPERAIARPSRHVAKPRPVASNDPEKTVAALSPLHAELVSALRNLGTKRAIAERAASAALDLAGPGATFETAFRLALKSTRA